MSAQLAQLPQLLQPRLESIPAFMRAQSRWAPCKIVPRKGRPDKTDKIPGAGLKVDNPRAWLPFDKARASHEKWPKDYPGISFVMTDLQGLVGIDLDNCVAGGQLAPWAADLVKRARSYAELSPSGTGVHIFVRGSLASVDGCDGQDWQHAISPDTDERIEVYGGGGRHITVTGHLVRGAAADVQDAPAGFFQWLWETYPRRGSRSVAAPTVDMPDLKECPPLDQLHLPVHARDFLESGECRGSDRSQELAAATAALYATGLIDGQVLRALADNEHAMRVALEHRRDDPEAALLYLWTHHCAKYRDKVGAPSPDEFEVIPAANGPRMLLEDAPEVPPPAPQRSDAPSAFPEPFPGPMRALVDAVLAVAPKPQPELATLAALIAMAASCPGSIRTGSGLRPNLYGVGVAETGAGKDLPRSAAVELARAGGAKIIGKPASGQGLEDEIESGRGMLAEVDEIAHMFEASNAPKAAPYLIELASVLLKLFTASQGTYNTRVLAKSKSNQPARAVRHPCFSLLGFTTPQKLGTALTFGNIADGLGGRMLFVRGRDDVAPRRARGAFRVPKEVEQAADALQHACSMADLVHDNGEIVVREDKPAAALLEHLVAALEQRPAVGDADFAQALFVRAYEKVERIAAVLAVWASPQAPVITRAHVEWAHRVVAASDAALLDFAQNHMHASPVQADAARVKEILAKCATGALRPLTSPEVVALKHGLVSRSMVLKHSKLDSQRFDAAVAHLGQLGEVHTGDLPKELCEGGRRVRVLKLEDAA